MSRQQPWRRLLQFGAGIGVAGLLCTVPVAAREALPTPAPVVALADLPAEARTVHDAVRSGGPFRFAKDGMAFGNRERLLPPARRGFYREYTVTTPGARDRGARRLVCGGERPTLPDTCFYTADHYSTFRRIAP